jgi:glycosyltransferase involved in cell wall biosynthesis
MPKVSVILPFFNRAATLARCVDSVRAQTFADWEVIAIDDGSTDGSAELLTSTRDSRMHVIRHEVNRGAGPARDAAMQAAHSEYFALIDSDDEWLPNKLEVQLAALERTGAALCSCAFHFIRGGETRTWPKPFAQGEWEKALHRECTFGFGTTLVIHRDLALRLGGFDPDLPRHEDWDWVLRAFEAGHQLAFVPEVLARVWAVDRVPLDRFIPSTEKFLAKHDAALRRHGDGYRRQVIAHHYETVASMAYEQRRYALGHRYLLRSFRTWPLRNPLPLAALPLAAIDWLLGTRTIQAGANLRRALSNEDPVRASA